MISVQKILHSFKDRDIMGLANAQRMKIRLKSKCVRVSWTKY